MKNATFTQIDADNNTYNGWANYETWNVSLWLNNDESLYRVVMNCDTFEDLLATFNELGSTPDGVSFTDDAIDLNEIRFMFDEMKA